MSKGLNNKLAGQIGEFLVCAELGKRGLIATSFTGNVPEFDLIVADEYLNTVPIQVKTSRSDNFPTKANTWLDIEICHETKSQIDHGLAKITNVDLIYICVSLSELDSDDKDRFFILKKSDLQHICSDNYRQWMNGLKWKRPRNYKSLDNRYYLKNLEPFENNWQLVTKQLNSKNFNSNNESQKTNRKGVDMNSDIQSVLNSCHNLTCQINVGERYRITNKGKYSGSLWLEVQREGFRLKLTGDVKSHLENFVNAHTSITSKEDQGYPIWLLPFNGFMEVIVQRFNDNSV